MERVPLEKPKYCDLIVLENCMLRCRMCRMWQCTRDPELVPMGYYYEFIESLYRYCGKDMQIQFVGGEPLMKQGILDVIRRASERGFFTTMTSNGFLVTRSKAEEILDTGISSITISLDSLHPEIHDRLRGVSGVHARAMNALRYMTHYPRPRQSVCVVTTIMQSTLSELELLVDWVEGNSGIACISFQAIAQPFFTKEDPLWYQRAEYQDLWPYDEVHVCGVIDSLIERKKQGAKIGNSITQLEQFKKYFLYPSKSAPWGTCHLGYQSLSVNSSGDAYLCFDQPPIGNIMRHSMNDMWESSHAEGVRRKIKTCVRNCKSRMNCFSEEGFSIHN